MAKLFPGPLNNNLTVLIRESKVLVVGAGGIGCELLKNLVMADFRDIEIIDLDTIDVSNLNRQFLFRKEHVGQSKALIARETASKFNKNSKIKAYHDDIMKKDYGVNFFERFKLVLNALDNRKARSHVNRMCLAADVPLIESGTAGYYGQVELIKKGVTQCYECEPKPAAEKTFPACTIRNTPSEFIHCVVWAKYLFAQLFGEEDCENEVSPDNENSNVTTRQWARNCKYNPLQLFKKIFVDDIFYLRSMDNLWKERVKPKIIEFNKRIDVSAADRFDRQIKDKNILPDHVVWTEEKCKVVFKETSVDLRSALNHKSEGDYLVWDKDDKLCLDFVTACATLRAYAFSIEPKSKFHVKAMAGNIIPAVATTNAIVAGLAVMKAFEALQNLYCNCCTVYVRHKPNHRGLQLVSEKYLTSSNPNCYVCSPKREIVISVNLNSFTVRELENVLKKSLHMNAPDVYVTSTNAILISSEEGETTSNNDRPLSEFQIADGTILKVDDFLQNFELNLILKHNENATVDEPFKILETSKQASIDEASKLKRRREETLESDDSDIVFDKTPGADVSEESTSSAVRKSSSRKNKKCNKKRCLRSKK